MSEQLQRLKKLVVARHGEPTAQGGLSSFGESAAEGLGQAISRFLQPPAVTSAETVLWSSSERRARETAEIIHALLGLAVETHEMLGFDERHRANARPEHVNQLLGDLEGRQAQRAVLVTHAEHIIPLTFTALSQLSRGFPRVMPLYTYATAYGIDAEKARSDSSYQPKLLVSDWKPQE